MSTTILDRPHTEKRILALQYLTLAWMLIECSAALTAAAQSRSVSLLAFGSDSFVELVSALLVLLQFTENHKISTAKAARFAGALLYILAAVVLLISILGLLFGSKPDDSRLGIAITVGALLLMPILARLKRNAAEETGNKALRADAVQSATCAYLAAVTLTGLLMRSFFAWHWLDPIAALVAVPILLVEAKRARKGQTCGCC